MLKEHGVAFQAGTLAFSVVSVPVAMAMAMAMAGWHLTRNLVIFLSGTVFIVFAVAVHVLPYFPARSPSLNPLPTYQFLSSQNDTPALKCFASLHEVEFTEAPSPHADITTEDEIASDADWYNWDWSWKQKTSNKCRFQKLERQEALQLLQGTWIVIAGDSQARLFFVALLELLLPSIEDLRPQLFKRHSNFDYFLEKENMHMEFVWAPYTNNLTRLTWEVCRNKTNPDVLVMGAGLWHMLHVGNHTHYRESLFKLKRALGSLLQSPKKIEDDNRVHNEDVPMSQIFWMNLPTVVPSLLQSETKRKQITNSQLRLYDLELIRSQVVQPDGPMMLLDIEKLSHSCGSRCSHDGIHFSTATYRAALHVMINALLIVSKQSPVT